MGVIAWIALGVAGGLLANILLPGKRSRGLIFIGLTCFAGVLGGGWTPELSRLPPSSCCSWRAWPVSARIITQSEQGAPAPAGDPGSRVIIPQDTGVLHRVSLRIGTTPPPPALPGRIPTPPHAAANGAAVS